MRPTDFLHGRIANHGSGNPRFCIERPLLLGIVEDDFRVKWLARVRYLESIFQPESRIPGIAQLEAALFHDVCPYDRKGDVPRVFLVQSIQMKKA